MAEMYDNLRNSCAAADALRQAIVGFQDKFPIVQDTICQLDNQNTGGNTVYCTGTEYCAYNARGYCDKRVKDMLSAISINRQLMSADKADLQQG